MISIVIIENDLHSTSLLPLMLNGTSFPVKVRRVLMSVQESVQYFSDDPHRTDLIISDVKLKDGLSFSIFDKVGIKCPIIFVADSNDYLAETFRYNGIAYLNRPVPADKLKAAITKYKNFESHFGKPARHVRLLRNTVKNIRKRVLVSKGGSQLLLFYKDIVLFYTEDATIYAIDKSGNKYTVERPLNVIENEMDRRVFFRTNRQSIVNINYIDTFKTYERVKILIRLKEMDQPIVVGQRRAKEFRQWIKNI